MRETTCSTKAGADRGLTGICRSTRLMLNSPGKMDDSRMRLVTGDGDCHRKWIPAICKWVQRKHKYVVKEYEIVFIQTGKKDWGWGKKAREEKERGFGFGVLEKECVEGNNREESITIVDDPNPIRKNIKNKQIQSHRFEDFSLLILSSSEVNQSKVSIHRCRFRTIDFRPSKLVCAICVTVMAYGGIYWLSCEVVPVSLDPAVAIRKGSDADADADTQNISIMIMHANFVFYINYIKTCGGKPVIDGRGPLSDSMQSTVGLGLTSLVNSDLTWKTGSKGNRRASRRARKRVTRSFIGSGELIDKDPKRVEDMPVSESEKLGVTILGRRFSDKVEPVPIKKRRLLFRSPSPPPRIPSPCPEETEWLINSQLASSQKESYPNSIAKQQLKAIDAAVVTKSGQVDAEKNLEEINEKLDDNEDFSGISILAAAACSNSMGGVGNHVKKSSVVEESSAQEGYPEVLANNESCSVAKGLSKEHLLDCAEISNEGTYSCISAIPVEETTASLVTAKSSPKDLAYGNNIEGPFFPDKSAVVPQSLSSSKDDGTARRIESSLRDDRSYWDLNIVMDSWERPCDALVVDSETNVAEDISEDVIHSEKLGNLLGCATQREPVDTQHDNEKTLQPMVGIVVSGDVHGPGDIYGVADSRNLALGTRESSREDHKIESHTSPEGITCFQEKVLSSDIDTAPKSVMDLAEETKPLHIQERISSSVESVVSASVQHALEPSSKAVADENSSTQCISFVYTGNRESLSSHQVVSMDACSECSPCPGSNHITSTLVYEERNAASIDAIGMQSKDDCGFDAQVAKTTCLSVQAEKHDVTLPHAEILSKATCEINSVNEDADRSSNLFDDGNAYKKTMSTDDFQPLGSGPLDDVMENAASKSDEMDVSQSSPNFQELSTPGGSVGKGRPVVSVDTKVQDGKVSVADTSEHDSPVMGDYELRARGDAVKESTNSAGLRMKMSGWDQLPEGCKSSADTVMKVRDDSPRKNHTSERIDGLNAEDSKTRVVESRTYRRGLLSRIEGPTSSDMLLRKDRVFIQGSRSNNLDDSNPRAERDTSSGRSIGRGGSSLQMHGRGWGVNRRFNSSECHWGDKRHHSPSYHGPAGLRPPGPKDAAAKVENSGFAVASDGSIVKAGGMGPHGSVHRQSINAPSQGVHRSLPRRRSPVNRDDAIGNMGIGQMGEMSPDRCITVGRGRSGRFGPRVFGRGPRERYLGPQRDGCIESSLRVPHPSARRERSFSPIQRRGARLLSRSHTRSPSRSRTGSPNVWPSPRGRSGAGIGSGPGLRHRSRSPPNFRVEARTERMRSPHQRPGFAVDHIAGFMSAPRSRSSQYTTRWIDDRKDAQDHFREHGCKQQLDRRSPERNFPRSHRFDMVDSPGRLKPDQFYRPSHPGRFPEMAGAGKGPRYGGSDDDRRKHVERYGMVHSVRRYDMDGVVKQFRYDAEEGFAPHNSHRKDSTEFHVRGSPKDYDKGIDSRLGDAPRRAREEKDHFRYGRDGKYNANSKSFSLRECDEDVAPRRRRHS
ncbi:hypothetical protein HHK36_027668 [Tetracentron sinense]|uniref:Uncharacterized protein n=1 Tax=Tetracentron sinense TaxID=13715 RepID=A0A835D3R5_TETSI|nr:hypothetical protein HHK36_027668 [Tetracentron sinense]